MKIMRSIKEVRIDWLKVAAAMSASNPYGPLIGPDGTVYSFGGEVLVPGAETEPATSSDAPAPATQPVRRNPRPACGVRTEPRALAA